MTTEDKPPEDSPGGSNVTLLAESRRKKARKKGHASGGPSSSDGRPEIKITKGDLPNILDSADKALGEGDPTIYAQHARLVRVVAFGCDDEQDNRIRRRSGAIVVQQVTAAHLRDRLAHVAAWWRFDGRAGDWFPADVPNAVAESFIARAGTWRHVRPLTGVVEAPTLREDGSVLDQPGYDSQSGIFFAGKLPDGYTPPSEKPSRDEALKALDLLWDAIRDFPTVGPEDRASIIAAMLTALVRRSLPSAPMIGISAPMPGTGKSKLADMIAILVTGRQAPVLSIGDDQAEGEKRLAAALLSGDAIVNLDNIERPLFGDLLCQVLSQPSVHLRPLGGSVQVTVVTNIAFLATGNNLDIRGDLKRRIVLARLDAKMERPEQRKFERDIIDIAIERRGEWIRACLTIIRAYLAAGRPSVDAAPYGGFEAWDAWCRRPLLWLDVPDPLLASEEVRAEDPDIALQRMLFTAWDKAFGQESVTAAEVAQRAVETDRIEAGKGNHLHPDLHEAVLAACGEKITSKRFGYWLRRHKMRVCDGYRLEMAGFDTHSKIAKWRLATIRAAGNAGNSG